MEYTTKEPNPDETINLYLNLTVENDRGVSSDI